MSFDGNKNGKLYKHSHIIIDDDVENKGQVLFGNSF